MAPMKKVPGAAGVATRCGLVKKAIQDAVGAPDRVKQMLCNTLTSTVGTPQADRHPFNERFVSMIEEVLAAEKTRLDQDVVAKEAHFNQLSPEKPNREATLEAKKGVTAEKGTAVDAAKQAVADIAATVKETKEKLVEAQKAQKTGDAEVDAIEARKTALEGKRGALAQLVEGTAAADEKDAMVADILAVGKDFHFDATLLNTAGPVFSRDVAERGGFDRTTLDQFQAAFDAAVQSLTEKIAEHQPAKTERANAVAAADEAKQAADTKQAELKEALATAKAAKADADAEQKAAAKSLSDFMPELKAAGDALDEAKKAVAEFQAGASTALAELKEYKEGDFVVKSYYQTVDGLKLDRALVESVTEAVAADGRVTLEDAKKILEKISDGNKVTKCELWTFRYVNQAFNWTEEAHDWIIDQIKLVPGGKTEEERAAKRARTSGKSYYEVMDGQRCDREIINVCREAAAPGEDGAERRISLEDAQKVWEKAADGKGVTTTEKWTLRMCLTLFKWSREGHDYVNEQIRKLDAAA